MSLGLITVRIQSNKVNSIRNLAHFSTRIIAQFKLLLNFSDYPVIFGKYDGKKMFVISNTSWLGGKNVFLGYAYIVVGSFFILLWIAFVLIVKKYSQK